MLADRRVKIVATIGPATQSENGLRQAIQAGMNVARLNFSHGTHVDHLSVIGHLRRLALELKAPVSILQDLQGPKIRVGRLEGGAMDLVPGETVILTTAAELGKKPFIPSDFPELPGACRPGTRILLDDGLIELKVIAVRGEEVDCEVIYGGRLKDRKGMNLPGAQLPVACLTEKDLRDLEFGLSQDVDYVALSFVRRGSDMKKLRELVNDQKPQTRLVAKIEMLEALDNLEEIIELSDAVMVARGDLAVEVGQAQLPATQKRIIRLCNQIGRPVITATQMLDSMVENPRPTRAEITDIANAVIDGSDALMLSAETASGKYPFECIRTMHEIAREVEKTSEYYKFHRREVAGDVAEAIAASASFSAQRLKAAVIVCLTTTGRTASLISQYRPRAPIIAVTHHLPTLNRLELSWGIQTFLIKPYKSTEEVLEQIESVLAQNGLARKGDQVVFTLGSPVQQGAKTNSLRVFTMSREAPAEISPDSRPLRCRNY